MPSTRRYTIEITEAETGKVVIFTGADWTGKGHDALERRPQLAAALAHARYFGKAPVPSTNRIR